MTPIKWIKLIPTSFLVISCAGCQGVPKPKGHIGVVHVKEVSSPYIHEYDMELDFDDDLHVIAGHNGVHRKLSQLSDLDKGIWMDAKSYANSLAAFAKLKARYQNCQTQ